MKKWKVIIDHQNVVSEMIVSGERYSDVYVDVMSDHPGCTILSISEIRSGKESEDSQS